MFFCFCADYTGIRGDSHKPEFNVDKKIKSVVGRWIPFVYIVIIRIDAHDLDGSISRIPWITITIVNKTKCGYSERVDAVVSDGFYGLTRFPVHQTLVSLPRTEFPQIDLRGERNNFCYVFHGTTCSSLNRVCQSYYSSGYTIITLTNLHIFTITFLRLKFREITIFKHTAICG